MTSIVFFNIFTGQRTTDSATVKAFIIISVRFRMSFVILLITFMRRSHQPHPLQFSSSSRISPLVGKASYLDHLTEHLIILKFFLLRLARQARNLFRFC